MNAVLRFLKMNRARLDLERFGIGERLSSVLITPRFRASSHVVILVFTEGGSDPVLVAKVPRLKGAQSSLEREVANLRSAHASCATGLDSIPRVVAFEEYCGRPMLVETALIGRAMDPTVVRRRLGDCCDAVIGWLTEVQSSLEYAPESEKGWYERLVERPLLYLSEVFPLSLEETRLLDRTRDLLSPLQGMRLPLVLEHGDLSSPNVMLLRDGGTGVVDWELADPHGLPTYDLFFFLTYAAFAVRKARTNGQYVRAFHEAFFGRKAWARQYVRVYAEQFELEFDALTPLFALCWVRYMASLLVRIGQFGYSKNQLGPETARWLRTNRYYSLWRHTLEQLNELDWSYLPRSKGSRSKIAHLAAKI